MKLTAWLASSLARQFPLGPAGGRQRLSMPAARNSQVSFQACLRLAGPDPAQVRALVRAPDDLDATVRRVGCVPMPHHNTETPADELDGVGFIPGYVPDPLFPGDVASAPPGEITAFWITVRVPADCRPGARKIAVRLVVDGRPAATMTAELLVSDVVLEPRQKFHVTQWFYADAICDWYRVEPFGEAFWPICRKYMADYAGHGCDTIYVPVFTPPLNGVKRPNQLLGLKRLGRDRYAFDWRLVRRWVAEARKSGIDRFEWPHLFTQWGARNAVRIYEGHGAGERLLWPPDTGATSPTYRRFLEQFLPELERFLTREKLLDRSFFHVSDEPHGDQQLATYREARSMLREIAPWMKVMDALSDIRFGREHLTDIPIPSISVTKQFADEGIPSWTYFCCGPRGRFLNRLLDTPLPKIRMSGWLFYRFGVGGFLHWGYNYWYKRSTRQMIDPFAVSDGLAWPDWAYGDTFVVYPGSDGPVDSIRWEVFAESLLDYALLETLGVDRDGRMLSALRDFDDFPKDAAWVRSSLAKLLLLKK